MVQCICLCQQACSPRFESPPICLASYLSCTHNVTFVALWRSVENWEKRNSGNRYWKFQANFWNLADLVVWEFAKVSGSNTLRCHYHERGTTRIWQDCFEGIAYKNWIWFFCCNFGCLKCVLYIYFYWSRHWKNIESFFTVCFLLILTPKLKSGPSLSPDIFSAQVPLNEILLKQRRN